ncbi:sugar transferase [Defluviimonas aestuarii]|uniref:sugar transferase n=1 Tax=Albidovulum aestuarii TaxID=1130726 RepID=UPI00249C7274|nr:sugar transferase [Defluviimonas aestuarii]MDI3337809.1 sugar transferase [Defluviimonas aestuarii]
MAAPLFEFRDDAVLNTQPSVYVTHGKRVLDIGLVFLALPVILPVLGIILGITALFGGQPLYSQYRIGRNGAAFRCWKVRTMVPNADRALAAILRDDPVLEQEWRQNQKLAHDPRVTRVGAILRKTSLDELPQLWNVLAGEMSLVGPRPFLPEQQALYDCRPCRASYYAMRPGITGSWQVGRRNRSSFGERALFDDDYSEQISLLTDLSILFRTVGVVLRATGV